MREYAQREPHGHERRVELRFLRSPGRDPRRGRGRPGHRHPDRQEPDRERPRGRHRRGGGHLLRPRDPLDRLPRRAAGGHPVRRAQGPDLQPRRPRARARAASTRSASTSSAGSSAARPASSAPTRRTRPTPSPAILEDREAGKLNTPKDADPAACEQFLVAAVPGARHVGGLARDRRARDRPRRAAGPPARQARAHGGDGRHRLRRQGVSTFTRAGGNTRVPAVGNSLATRRGDTQCDGLP